MRLLGWEKRLAARIKAAGGQSFEWGMFDCCIFAADCVQDITGKDLMAEMRGKYTSELGAAKLIKKVGGLPAYLTKTLGHEIRFEQAKRGDVVMFGDVVGVCVGAQFVAPMKAGLYFCPMANVSSAWGVQ